MPIVEITALKGRDNAQKEAMYEAVTEAIHRTFNVAREDVRIILHEKERIDICVGGKVRLPAKT
jgi:4-oxalocrotonate tautomerase family enzyme